MAAGRATAPYPSPLLLGVRRLFKLRRRYSSASGHVPDASVIRPLTSPNLYTAKAERKTIRRPPFVDFMALVSSADRPPGAGNGTRRDARRAEECQPDDYLAASTAWFIAHADARRGGRGPLIILRRLKLQTSLLHNELCARGVSTFAISCPAQRSSTCAARMRVDIAAILVSMLWLHAPRLAVGGARIQLLGKFLPLNRVTPRVSPIIRSMTPVPVRFGLSRGSRQLY